MHWHSDPFEPPDVSEEERGSNQMIKLVRKLRWIGQDMEAELVATLLRQRAARRTLSTALSASVRRPTSGWRDRCVKDSGEE